MKISAVYSHLNGKEFLQVHHPRVWPQVKSVIKSVNATACRTKVSKEVRTMGEIFYSPIAMNAAMRDGFKKLGWSERRTSYWVTSDAKLIRKTMTMPPAQQKAEIEAAGLEAIFSYNQTDMVRDRIAIEVQFGKYSFVAYDLFVKHLAFYVGDVIDVGIEILPMKSLQSQMSSGVPYYEGELYNLIREGRGVPAVPLVLIGISV